MEFSKVKVVLACVSLLMSIASLSVDKWEIQNKEDTSENECKGIWNACARGHCEPLPATGK